jgi:hypothetical protein
MQSRSHTILKLYEDARTEDFQSEVINLDNMPHYGS